MPVGQATSVGAANHLRLELEFTLKSLPVDPFFAGMGGSIEQSSRSIVGRSATLEECTVLLTAVSSWLQVAETRSSYGEGPDIGQYFKQPYQQGSSSTVRVLHYGSPFLLDISLSQVISPVGLGFLFLGAKRLFGADLEFRAHREQRRVEYLEARRHREALEDLPDPELVFGPADAADRSAWSLMTGVISDESE